MGVGPWAPPWPPWVPPWASLGPPWPPPGPPWTPPGASFDSLWFPSVSHGSLGARLHVRKKAGWSLWGTSCLKTMFSYWFLHVSWRPFGDGKTHEYPALVITGASGPPRAPPGTPTAPRKAPRDPPGKRHDPPGGSQGPPRGPKNSCKTPREGPRERFGDF